MALKKSLGVMLVAAALLSGAGLAREVLRWFAQRDYNDALAQGDYARAARVGGDLGRFAQAYGLQQAGKLQDARVLYSKLERSHDAALRVAALYNMGNTYLDEAATIDLHKDADRALPLIELAKHRSLDELRTALDAEVRAEQAKDRDYWEPLRRELERFRHEQRGS